MLGPVNSQQSQSFVVLRLSAEHHKPSNCLDLRRASITADNSRALFDEEGGLCQDQF